MFRGLGDVMKLFIRIKDGKPFEHPIMEDNFLQAFPDIDVNNLPSNFAVFNRVARPEIGVYEIYEGVTYEFDGAVVSDTHHVRLMTDAEKVKKQTDTKKQWSEIGGYGSWVFNEELCVFEPPTPRPQEGSWLWDEETISWIKNVQEDTN